jgi:YD repeat-containing protein
LLKRTVFAYDAEGNLTQRDEIDPGSTPTTRTWKWTYTTFGRVLTQTDANNKVTTYTYHPDNDPVVGKRGNLATVTNPSGHLTQYTAYDGNARPTTIIDPNGATSTLTYHPRGWLTSVALAASGATRTTSIAYLANGKVDRITQPDGSYLQMGYDAAQRLTSVADNLGNRVDYTLDNAGNRLDEQYKDSSNALHQRITRVYDTLDRLQTVTGALQ